MLGYPSLSGQHSVKHLRLSPYAGYIQALQMTKELMLDRMYPLTLEGLDQGMRALQHKTH